MYISSEMAVLLRNTHNLGKSAALPPLSNLNHQPSTSMAWLMMKYISFQTAQLTRAPQVDNWF